MLRYFPGFLGFYVRGQVYTDDINKEKDKNMNDRYTTVLVTTATKSFYQAIHRLDWFKEIESLKKQGAISIVIAK